MTLTLWRKATLADWPDICRCQMELEDHAGWLVDKPPFLHPRVEWWVAVREGKIVSALYCEGMGEVTMAGHDAAATLKFKEQANAFALGWRHQKYRFLTCTVPSKMGTVIGRHLVEAGFVNVSVGQDHFLMDLR